jgi:hypothetical protein
VRIGRLLSDHERPVGFPIAWKQVFQRELLLDLHFFGLPRVQGSLDSLKDHSLNRFLEPFGLMWRGCRELNSDLKVRSLAPSSVGRHPHIGSGREI